MASKNKWGGAPTDKCVGCAKTVYPAEKLVMEGQIWHIECLRCTECSKKLTGANFGGFMPPDNKPYCKIHFDRIIISSGKGGASSTAAWTPKETSGEESASSSGKFGSRPTDRCELCSKIVYPAEKFSIEGRIFHTGCLKCKECSKQLGGSNWGGFLENDPYCKIHFDRIIISSGKGGISSVAEWTPKESSGGDSGDKPKSKYGGAPSEKCEKCGKTVYPAERLNMEGRVFHHGCLSCGECGKKLTGANFGGFVAPQEGETEEKVFCTVHLKQLVSRLGDSTKLSGAGTGGWTPKESSGSTGDRPKSKYGTQNHEKCVKCAKTVYPAEKISMEGRIYHGQCLRCVECNKALTGANWGAFLPPQFDPYCKTHYTQLVMARGDSTSLSGTGATGL